MELWKHQVDTINRALGSNELAILADPGTGKTRSLIEILRAKCNYEHRLLKTLIFCPKVVCTNWKEELSKFSNIKPENVHVLLGKGTDRISKINSLESGVIITNYQSMTMAGVFEALQGWGAEFLVCDESHRVKNSQAVTTKKIAALSAGTRYRYLLSGTPILRDYRDVFGQWLILDKGESFGKNYFLFQNEYFYDKNYSLPWATWKEYVIKPNYDSLIKAIMAKKAVFIKKEDCLDLPPFIRKKIIVELSSEQRKAYTQMENDLISYVNDKACVASIAITKALRLQQITSGFIPVEDSMTAKRETIGFKDVPRLDALKELLEDLLETTDKIIVWACWRENYAQLRRLFESIGVKYAEIHGEITDKKREEDINNFRNDKEYRLLIGNQGAGGIGINLIEAQAAVYYSRNFSLEHDIQSEARNYRGGSERHSHITRYDLVAKDTIDEQVLERLAEKKAIGDDLVNQYRRK
jgi:SNF2 family DNA or RNA helicase